MKAIALTAAQIVALAPLNAAHTKAASDHQAANAAVKAQLASIASAAGVTVRHPRLTLSDDGKFLIVE